MQFSTLTKQVTKYEPRTSSHYHNQEKRWPWRPPRRAWKVAYADFVTAMMALFIVLWLLNSSVQVRKAVSAYFTDPSGSGKLSGSAAAGTGEAVSVSKDDMSDLKDKLEQAIKKSPDLAKLKDYVQMSVTGEGLRVEMLESDKGMFFKSGSALPSEVGYELLVALSSELSKLPNNVMIEGHTDARPFNSRKDYSNWELSTDRANSARRLMEANGLPPGKVIQVRGFADQNLRDPEHPDDAKNRRISVIVRYKNVQPSDDDESDAGEKYEGTETKANGEKTVADRKEPVAAVTVSPPKAESKAGPKPGHKPEPKSAYRHEGQE
jgi:chemotaxis protein MotB